MKEPSIITSFARQLLDAGMSREEGLRLVEREFLIGCLEREQGNVCRAARRARVHRNTFSRQLEQHHLAALPAQLRHGYRRQKEILFSRRRPAASAVQKTVEAHE